jgi:Lrp/AsnC family transcriptional regulator for asnA, asnC and gidA
MMRPQSAAVPGDAPTIRAAVDLSDADRSIIRLLQGDGRMAAAQIARATGLTVRVVRRHLADLQENGTIQITTVADPMMLGYRSLAMVALTVDASRPPSEVARDLAGLDATDYVVQVTGRYDILLEVVCRDVADLRSTLETRIAVAGGVRSVETFPYLRLRYQEPVWDVARGRTGRTGVAPAVVPLDDVDRALVRELSADGRAPFRDLARSAGVSESQARARVARLTSSGAVRVMAITKPRSLGFQTLAWLGIRAAPGTRIADLADRLTDVPSVAYLAITAGRFDVLVEAVCVDDQDLGRVLDDEIRTLEGVGDVEAYLVLDQHYERIRPLI